MSELGALVYEDLIARGRRLSTAKQWRALAEKFEGCCGVKAVYERSDVIKFLAMLRSEGHKQSSINTMIRPIKLLAEVQMWQFPRLAMKKVRESDINRPVFSFAEVNELIRRGREVLSARELADLALSTTYGLRREELTSLDVGDGVVTVNTVKDGPVTTHLIPDEIKGYVEGYEPIGDVRYLSLVFQRIVDKVGMDLNGKAYGWHAIRRALVTELVLRDVSLLHIIRFMRWSIGVFRGEFGMIEVYAVRDQEKIDKAIFRVHPFLKFWG